MRSLSLCILLWRGEVEVVDLGVGAGSSAMQYAKWIEWTTRGNSLIFMDNSHNNAGIVYRGVTGKH